MDQPKAVLTIPQGKSLLAKRTAHARDGGLFGSTSAIVPLKLESVLLGGGYVSRTAFGLAAAVLLTSANQEGALRLRGEKMGIYE